MVITGWRLRLVDGRMKYIVGLLDGGKLLDTLEWRMDGEKIWTRGGYTKDRQGAVRQAHAYWGVALPPSLKNLKTKREEQRS